MTPKDEIGSFLRKAAIAAGIGVFLRGSSNPEKGEILQQPKPKVQSTEPSPYQAKVSPYGRLVVTVDGCQIGSLFDTDPFKESLELPYSRNWVTVPRLEIAERFEEYVQQSLKSLGPRRYSGLYPYSHIVRDVHEALSMSKQANVSLDFVILLALMGHDLIEDDLEIMGLHSQWEKALLSGDHASRQNLETKIRNTRIVKNKAIEQELISYIPPNVRGSEREDIKREIEMAVRLIYDVTRFSNELPYALSMGHQFTRDGNEYLSQTFRRMIVKGPDLNTNMKEICPMFEEPTMLGINNAFSDRASIVGDFNVGEELSNRYGSVRVEHAFMHPAEIVGATINRHYPLHFANQTFARYEPLIITGKYNGNKAESARAEQLLRLAKLIRDKVGTTALEALTFVTGFYEANDDSIRAIKPIVEEEIREKQQSTFFKRATLDGYLRQWLLDDGGGGKYFRLLDYYDHHRKRIYSDAKKAMALIPSFIGPQNETIDDIDIFMSLMPDYWALVASKKRELVRMEAEVNEMIRSGRIANVIKALYK